MVVYIMSQVWNGATHTHRGIRSRHVDVTFPSAAECGATRIDDAAVSPTPPPSSSIGRPARASMRYGGQVTPSPLIPPEWLASLVQYVAEQKKAIYNGARDDLLEAIKSSIPLEMKEKVGKRSELSTTAGVLYGGQLSESVATHQSLTSTMSIRRLKEAETQNQDLLHTAFMSVSAHYMGDSVQVNFSDAMDKDGKLDALRQNAMMVHLKGFFHKERVDRRSLEADFWGRLLSIAQDCEDEFRCYLLAEEEKMRNKHAAAEVGEYLSVRKQVQLQLRNATIQRASESLKAERDALRETVKAVAARERDETTQVRESARETTDKLVNELPLKPNLSNVDAEVARQILLLERRRQGTDYFPGML